MPHLELVGRAPPGIFTLQFFVFEAGVIEHESAIGAFDQINTEGLAVPDSPGYKGRNESLLEAFDWLFADYTVGNFNHQTARLLRFPFILSPTH